MPLWTWHGRVHSLSQGLIRQWSLPVDGTLRLSSLHLNFTSREWFYLSSSDKEKSTVKSVVFLSLSICSCQGNSDTIIAVHHVYLTPGFAYNLTQCLKCAKEAEGLLWNQPTGMHDLITYSYNWSPGNYFRNKNEWLGKGYNPKRRQEDPLLKWQHPYGDGAWSVKISVQRSTNFSLQGTLKD